MAKTHVPGDPNWVDLGTTDLDAARAFYAGLFGWTVDPGPPEFGGYTMGILDGQPVAGLRTLSDDEIKGGAPPSWTVYFKPRDIDDTAGKIKDAGGQLLSGPMQVMTAGKLAVAQDAAGAVFGLWEPGDHPGFGLENVPGTVDWVENGTRDAKAAKAFYAAVFGWTTAPMGPDADYLIYTNGDHGVGGLMDITEALPAEVPPHWLTYFKTADIASTVATAKSLGGTVNMDAQEFSEGSFAVLTDPQGAVFGVFQGKA